jgi:hypothetical protein
MGEPTIYNVTLIQRTIENVNTDVPNSQIQNGDTL